MTAKRNAMLTLLVCRARVALIGMNSRRFSDIRPISSRAPRAAHVTGQPLSHGTRQMSASMRRRIRPRAAVGSIRSHEPAARIQLIVGRDEAGGGEASERVWPSRDSAPPRAG